MGSGKQEGVGLFVGFEGYRTPAPDDYASVLMSGLVVPDTNVLLNLYRYNAQTRTDLLAVLQSLGDRLWVPHQVVEEFWRNRETALRDPFDMAEATINALDEHNARVVSTLRQWANRIALPEERLEEMQISVDMGFEGAIAVVHEFTESSGSKPDWNTNNDQVLGQLVAVLDGRVGSPLDQAASEAAIKEGLHRIESDIPPGYADKDKAAGGGVGDYLVWEQTLLEAEARHSDVLLVTGDVKEDWWRRERGEIRGPRPELVEELRRRAGTRLFMLRPESLLIHAQTALQVEVREESVQDVERVDRSLSVGGSGGWSRATLSSLMERLTDEGPVQAASIRLAATQEGFVSRDQVYELGDFDESRTLRGFTRPVRRIAQAIRDRGAIPEEAIDVLEAEYDPGISYVQASGFRIPPELVPLLLELDDESS